MSENAQDELVDGEVVEPEKLPAAPATIIEPFTGEALALADATDEQLASIVVWIREQEDQAKGAKRDISQEVHRRMDSDALWTRDAGPYRLKGQAPASADYDADRLKEALDLLVEDGLISPEARESAIEEETSWKVKKRGVQALAKLGGEVAALIAEAEKPPKDPASRRLDVKRVARG